MSVAPLSSSSAVRSNSIAAMKSSYTPAPSLADVEAGRAVLKQGMQGSAVKSLQTLLAKEGYNVSTDGKFGPQTDAAVRAFQKKHSLTPDGLAGKKTLAALQSSYTPAPSPGTGTTGTNAILSKYKPTGASAATARQDGLSAGPAASAKMAKNDLARLKPYKAQFEAAGKKYGVPPALLAAIASRESRGGAALDSRGYGDAGNGFGLMQVDKRSHTLKGGPYSAEHINQAAGILKSYLTSVKKSHPSWPPEQQLRGAVAAYNSGPGNVQTIAGMDRGTTGNDYSNDVWARAQTLAPNFGG
jgi:peptidoglycan hydrolase-like protein with peptidoglycan-binding domain